MIRFGENGDIPQLKHLWKECFADEDAYIDAFFFMRCIKRKMCFWRRKRGCFWEHPFFCREAFI